jgi:hypothetical protein
MLPNINCFYVMNLWWCIYWDFSNYLTKLDIDLKSDLGLKPSFKAHSSLLKHGC